MNIEENNFEEMMRMFEERQTAYYREKLILLEKQAPLIPIKSEIYQHALEFIEILDFDIRFFLLSRFLPSSINKSLSYVLFEFFSKRANLILTDLEDLHV